MAKKNIGARSAGAETWEQHTAELQRLDRKVLDAEDHGLRARWEFGRYMLTIRGDKKQLPPGILKRFAVDLEVHRSELSARMKFAALFSTEQELSKVIRNYGTWFNVKQQALTSGDRRRLPARKSPLGRLLTALESLDPTTTDAHELQRAQALIARLLTAKATLAEKEAA